MVRLLNTRNEKKLIMRLLRCARNDGIERHCEEGRRGSLLIGVTIMRLLRVARNDDLLV